MSFSLRRWLSNPHGPRGTLLIRLIVGVIFLSEGAQKFLFPEELGVGRFVKIGIPMASVMAPFVGVVEIVGGLLLVVGLATRLVCVPMLINMLVAITSTKLVAFGKNGFWKTMHEARTDLLMIACLLFLLAVGAGSLSLDRRLLKTDESANG
jgi:putative oxidoreductase